MASKKRFSYRLRLFIPIVTMMWVVVGVLVIYHYNREVKYRSDTINNQLQLVSNRIVDAYEHGDAMAPFMGFLDRYLTNSRLDAVIVQVYNEHDSITQTMGMPSSLRLMDMGETEQSEGAIMYADPDGHLQRFYHSSCSSMDGRCVVHIAMPYTVSVSEALLTESSFWLLVVAMAVTVTIMAWYTTKFLSRNVTMLRDFATDIEQHKFDPAMMPDFPHDELGDISRRIVRLYREKDDAIRRSERDHGIAINAMREQERIKTQMTNNINHELKTPIGVVRGYLDTICDTPDLDDAMRDKFLGRARQNIERLCSLLDDVSTMTRLEEGGANLPVTEVNFHDIIFNIENDLDASGLAGSLKFSYDLPVNCKVRGNVNLLTAMISNLIKNAAIHSHGTEMGLRLTIQSPNYYTFSFWDNGVGVREENLPRLFERFFREDTGRSRKVGGTGLGLPIVKSTVEALGGTISAHNRSTGGLEFNFTLRKWQDEA